MKKIALIAVSAVILAAATNYLAFAKQQTQEKVIIDVIKKTKGAVEFAHKRHAEEYKIECMDCHHTFRDDRDFQACPDCHFPTKANYVYTVGISPPIKLDPEGKKNIYHTRCNEECHSEKRAGSSPKKCNECHGGKD